MATALHVCGGANCSALAPKGQPRCPACTTVKEQERGSRHARGYTNDWARMSLQFRKAHPFCGMRPGGVPPVMSRCHDEGRLTEVVGSINGRPRGQTDHVVPHRGDKALFFDPTKRVEDQPNWQSLCSACGAAKSLAGL